MGRTSARMKTSAMEYFWIDPVTRSAKASGVFTILDRDEVRNRRDPAGQGGPGAAGEIVGGAGLGVLVGAFTDGLQFQMGMSIDDAGHQEHAGGIDLLAHRATR